tara:strand:+ start:1403 stop:2044 length:642 start_codon:yes stop_codon:yes gene_type:complete
MDGNMRWSKLKKLNYFDSYLAGAKNLLNLSEYIFNNYNISYISAFALSKNNLKRSPKLISTLKDVLEYFLNSVQKDSKKSYQVIFKGDKSFLKSYLLKKIDKLENLNTNRSKKLFIYINYSGQDDILEACKKLIKSKKRVNYNNFIDNLVTGNIPFPDMLIRTGGYKRISDFMLFQSSFSELMFTDKLWPNFKKVDLDKFIQNYNKIDRKFGH